MLLSQDVSKKIDAYTAKYAITDCNYCNYCNYCNNKYKYTCNDDDDGDDGGGGAVAVEDDKYVRMVYRPA